MSGSGLAVEFPAVPQFVVFAATISWPVPFIDEGPILPSWPSLPSLLAACHTGVGPLLWVIIQVDSEKKGITCKVAQTVILARFSGLLDDPQCYCCHTSKTSFAVEAICIVLAFVAAPPSQLPKCRCFPLIKLTPQAEESRLPSTCSEHYVDPLPLPWNTWAYNGVTVSHLCPEVVERWRTPLFVLLMMVPSGSGHWTWSTISLREIYTYSEDVDE